jgi:hypothetical protein
MKSSSTNLKKKERKKKDELDYDLQHTFTLPT